MKEERSGRIRLRQGRVGEDNGNQLVECLLAGWGLVKGVLLHKFCEQFCNSSIIGNEGALIPQDA